MAQSGAVGAQVKGCRSLGGLAGAGRLGNAPHLWLRISGLVFTGRRDVQPEERAGEGMPGSRSRVCQGRASCIAACQARLGDQWQGRSVCAEEQGESGRRAGTRLESEAQAEAPRQPVGLGAGTRSHGWLSPGVILAAVLQGLGVRPSWATWQWVGRVRPGHICHMKPKVKTELGGRQGRGRQGGDMVLSWGQSWMHCPRLGAPAVNRLTRPLTVSQAPADSVLPEDSAAVGSDHR